MSDLVYDSAATATSARPALESCASCTLLGAAPNADGPIPSHPPFFKKGKKINIKANSPRLH